MSGGTADVELLTSVACELVDGVFAQGKLRICDRAVVAFIFRFVSLDG